MKKLIVYGKTGCQKCEILQRRLEKMGLSFELRKVDTLTGLILFCRAEQLNPSRIPAVLVEEDGKPLVDDSGKTAELLGTCALPSIAGMQTDYENGGVLRPADIQTLVDTWM